METKAALVRTDGAVELDAVAHVDMSLAVVVDPGDTEHDSALRHGQTLQQSLTAVCGFILINHRTQRFQDLSDGLNEFGLVCILLGNQCQGFIYITHKQMSSLQRFLMSPL